MEWILIITMYSKNIMQQCGGSQMYCVDRTEVIRGFNSKEECTRAGVAYIWGDQEPNPNNLQFNNAPPGNDYGFACILGNNKR